MHFFPNFRIPWPYCAKGCMKATENKGHSDCYLHLSDLQTFVNVYRFTLIEGHPWPATSEKKAKTYVRLGPDMSMYTYCTSCRAQVVVVNP